MRQLDGYMLWLGHFGDVADTRTIIETGILVVVDLAREESPAILPRDFTYCRFPLTDGTGNSASLILAAVETVACFLRLNTPTFVYCSAGMSRSPCIAGAAIALVRECSFDEARKTRVKLGAHRRIARSMGGCSNCSRLIPLAQSPCRTPEPSRRASVMSVPTARAQPFCRPVWRLLQVTPSRLKHSSGLAKSRSTDLTAVTSCNRMPVTSCN